MIIASFATRFQTPYKHTKQSPMVLDQSFTSLVVITHHSFTIANSFKLLQPLLPKASAAHITFCEQPQRRAQVQRSPVPTHSTNIRIMLRKRVYTSA